MMAAYLRRVKIAPDLGACGRCYVLPMRSQRRHCSVQRDLSIPDKTSSTPRAGGLKKRLIRYPYSCLTETQFVRLYPWYSALYSARPSRPRYSSILSLPRALLSVSEGLMSGVILVCFGLWGIGVYFRRSKGSWTSVHKISCYFFSPRKEWTTLDASLA